MRRESTDVKNKGQHSTVFGKKKEPHTVIIARGSHIRHFTIRPWLVTAFAGTLTALSIGYLAATAYLVFRDDIVSAASARQARIQQAYEDRIAALRAQVDRITSRQMLDQQMVETKVSELMARQEALNARHGKIGETISEAAVEQDSPAIETPSIETPGMDKPQAMLDSGGQPLAYGSMGAQPFLSASNDETAADRADRNFVAIHKSLEAVEADQLRKLDTMATNAYRESSVLGDALRTAGVDIEDDYGKADVGGPLVPLDQAGIFDSKVKELDEALDRLGGLKQEARALPFANPAPGRSVSSRFGVRTDPLLGTPAMHSGMDFRAPSGTPILATGYGTVTEAGWNGGYGQMVEIKHANGFATRFGHMSAIHVTVGEQVKPGDVLGEVGSTGRSTGPHMHYEIRRNGVAIDPADFLAAGKRIEHYL
ncbi:MAG: peptidoglycan DD-metalloendopeptidase family protein [Rhizobiaceae bacterium]|nr:peptidoglycan DD-metalloendopeptidase family protein [Rhizobiaceae bacterium]